MVAAHKDRPQLDKFGRSAIPEEAAPRGTVPIMHLDTGPHLQEHTLAKLNSGPDPTEKRLRISNFRYADFAKLNESHKVDALGYPELRAALIRFLDGAYQATEDGQAKHAALEALRNHAKRSHRRAYMILIAYYGGMTQEDMAMTAGTGGKRISQQRVSTIIRLGIAWLTGIAENSTSGRVH
jgi:hypothetical protein